jgi:hypothetical protein
MAYCYPSKWTHVNAPTCVLVLLMINKILFRKKESKWIHVNIPLQGWTIAEKSISKTKQPILNKFMNDRFVSNIIPQHKNYTSSCFSGTLTILQKRYSNLIKLR